MNKLMRVLKVASVVFLLGFLVFLNQRNHVKDVSMAEFEHAFAPQVEGYELEKGDDKALRRFYDLSAGDLDGYMLYIPNAVMSVDEVLIAKAKTKDGADSISKAVNSRIESQKKSFDGYGVNQTGLLNQAQVVTKGEYVFFAVSKDAAKWVKLFAEMVQ